MPPKSRRTASNLSRLFSTPTRAARSRRWRDAFPRLLPLVGDKADGIVRSLVGLCRRVLAQPARRKLRPVGTQAGTLGQIEPLEPRQLLATDLVISEIMYDPASAEDDWEWIEIVNTTGAAIDLSGYVVDDNNTVAHTNSNIAAGSVPAGGSAVLYNADDLSAADFAAAWGSGVNLIAVGGWSSMQLNNTGDTIGIWDGFGQYTGDHATHASVVAGVTYGTTSPWPSVNDSASIYLTDLANDPNVGDSWSLTTVGGSTPAYAGHLSSAAGGNSGGDVGSPVNNAPEITNLSITPIEENQTATLTGSFADPDAADNHWVWIEWGDGQDEVVAVTPGEYTFSADHHYFQDGDYDVRVELSDREVTAGIVGLWNFDDATGQDTSGHGNDGTVGSNLTFDATDVPPAIAGGQSLDASSTLDGGNGIVTVPNSPSLQAMDDQLTVAFWMKGTTTSNQNWFRIMRKATGGRGTPGWIVNRSGSGTDMLMRTDTTGDDGLFNQNRHGNVGPVLDGQWHHVAYVLNSGSTREYIDGAFVNEATYPHGSGLANSLPLTIAGRGNDDDYVGLMDDVAVWRRALTADEVGDVAGGAIPAGPHTDAQIVTATVTNVPPVAGPGTLTTDQNTPAAFDHAAFVTDQGPLDTFTVTNVTQPTLGSVSPAGGVATFDPGADFDYLAAGEQHQVTFGYTVRDEAGDTSGNTVTATVTGLNDAPHITNLIVDPIPVGGAATLDGEFTDPDLTDKHWVWIRWGDGDEDVVHLTSNERTFSASHTYTQDDIYDVQVEISDRDVSPGIVGLWNFDDGNAQDQSGWDNHGTGGTFGTDTPFSSGQAFADGGISILNSSSLQSPDDQVTVAFWVKAVEASTLDWARLAVKQKDSVGWHAGRYRGDNAINIRTDTTGTGGGFNKNILNSGDGTFDNTWHHVAFVLSSGSGQKYIDGTLKQTATYPHGNGLSNGGSLLLGSSRLDGAMDDVALWNRALTGPEIAHLAAAAIGEGPLSDVQSTPVVVATGFVAVDGTGNLTIMDTAASGKNDQLTITYDSVGDEYVLSDPVNLLAIDANIVGSTQGADGHEVRVPRSAVGRAMVIHTLAGDDSLTIDFSGGNPLPPGGLMFHGGTQSAAGPGDSLALTGGSFDTITYVYDNAHDGTIELDPDGTGGAGSSLITYTGLEPIDDQVVADDRVFTFDDTPDDITLADNGDPADGMLTISSVSSSETTTFLKPSGKVIINSAGGADVIRIEQLDTGFVPVASFADFSDVSAFTLNSNKAPAPASVDDGGVDVLRVGYNGVGSYAGTAFLTEPVPIASGTSFSTNFTFRVHPFNNTGNNTADGLAFIVQNDTQGPAEFGGAGSGVGYNGIAKSMAVGFRNWGNRDVSIWTNGNTGSPLVEIPEPFNMDGPNAAMDDTIPVYVWIDYDGSSQLLSVYLSQTNTKPAAPNMTGMVDLPTLVGDQAYFGFSSGTGGATGDHDIRDWDLAVSHNLLEINAGAGADQVNVDALPDAGFDALQVDGGSEADRLALENGNFGTVVHHLDAAGDGSIDLDHRTITYTGIEPIDDTLPALSREFYLSDGGDVASLEDNGTATDGILRLSTVGSDTRVDFQKPAWELTIDGRNGADMIDFNATDTADPDAGPAFSDFNGNGAFAVTSNLASRQPAAVDAGGSDVLRLGFSNIKSYAGAAYLPTPIDVTDSTSFSSAFEFRIHNGTGANGGADGFTFVLQNDPNGVTALGADGGELGYVANASKGAPDGVRNSLAVAFRTYSQNRVDILRDGSWTNLGGASASPDDLNDGSLFYAWVDYDGAANQLEVYLNKGSNTKPATPLATASIDLSLVVGEQAYVGFTAGTGGATNDHDIRAFSFTTDETARMAIRGGSGGDSINVTGTSTLRTADILGGADNDQVSLQANPTEFFVDLSTGSNDLAVTFPGGVTDAVVAEDAVGSDGFSQITSAGGAFGDVAFQNPAGSLTLGAAGGGTTVQLESFDPLIAIATINLDNLLAEVGAAAAVTSSSDVHVADGATLDLKGARMTNAGAAVASAPTIHIAGTGTAAQGALVSTDGFGGDFADVGDLVLTADATINTTARIDVWGDLQGNFELTKLGTSLSQVLGLRGSASTLGGLTVQEGRARLENGGVGTWAGTITVNPDGRLSQYGNFNANTGNPNTDIILNGGRLDAEAGGTSRWRGDVTVSADSIVDTTNGRIDLFGDISGTHQLTKTGGREFAIRGGISSLDGIDIQQGRVRVENVDLTGTWTGPVVVNSGTFFSTWGSRSVNAPVTLAGGVLQTENNGTGTWTGDITVTAQSNIETPGTSTSIINAGLSGTAQLNKTGPGTLTINSSGNNLDSAFYVKGGIVNVPGGITTRQKTIIHGGATVNWSGTGAWETAADNWVGVGDGGDGYLNMTAGSLVITPSTGSGFFIGNASTGTVSVSGGTLTLNNNAPLRIGGIPNVSNSDGTMTISGTGQVIATGTSAQQILIGSSSGTTNVTGELNLDGGSLETARSIRRTSTTTAVGTLSFNGGTLKATGDNSDWISGLTGAYVGAGGAVIDTQNYSLAIAQDLLHDPALGATVDGGLTKSGTGTLALGGDNTYTGVSTVANGTLLVNGSTVDGPATDDVVVESGGVIGGTGTIGGRVRVNSGGTAAPGTSPGTTTSEDLMLSTGSTFAVELDGNSPGNGAGFHDQWIVTDEVDLGGATLDVTLGGTFTPAAGSAYVIVRNDGPNQVQGTFTVPATDGGTITVGGRTYYVFYNGGDGNDVVLVDASTPTTVYVNDDWLGTSDGILLDGDLELPGNQQATFGVTAFATIADALAANSNYSGDIVVNGGSYGSADLTGGGAVTLKLVQDLAAGEPDVTIGTFQGDANDAVLTRAHQVYASPGQNVVNDEVTLVTNPAFEKGPNDSGKLYFAYTVTNPGSFAPDSEPYFAALQLRDAGTEILGVGNHTGAWAYSTFGATGNADLRSANHDAGQFYQRVRATDITTLVFRIDFGPSGTDDDLTVWVDPSGSLPEANQGADLTTTFTNLNLNFDQLSLRHGGGGSGWNFGDIRVANTFEAAVTSGANLIVGDGTDTTFVGTISGAGDVTKQGTGTLTLAGANDYTGLTTISAGTVKLGDNSALGSVTGKTVIEPDATLDIAGFRAGATGDEPVEVSGAGVGGNGAIVNSGGTQTGAFRDLTLLGPTTFGGTGRWDIRNSGGAATFDVNGHQVTKVGGNNVSLVNATVIDPGDVDITGGIFRIEGSTNYNAATPATIDVHAGGRLDFWNAGITHNQNINLLGNATLSANANSSPQLSGTVTLTGSNTIGAGNEHQSPTLTITGQMTGTGGFTMTTKAGNSGILALDGDNDYAGVTTIAAGTVRVGHPDALGRPATGDTSTVVQDGATLDLNSVSATLSGGTEIVTISGAGVDTTGDGNGDGALVNNGASTIYWGVEQLLIDGSAAIGGTNRWDLRNQLVRSAGATPATLTKLGPNYVAFSGIDSDGDGALGGLGDIFINQGTLSFESSGAVGLAANTMTVGPAGILRFWTGGNITNTKNIVSNGGIIEGENGTSTVNGLVTLNAATTFQGAGTLLLNADVVGGNNLIKTDTGTLQLAGTGNVLGTIVVNGNGTLELVADSVTAASRVEVGQGTDGTLNVKDNAELTVSTYFLLGNPAGVSGTVNQSGGLVHSTGTGDNQFRIAHWGSETSRYNLTDGKLDVDGVLNVGWDGVGHLTVDGAQTELEAASISVGRENGSTLTIDDGTVTTGSFYVGQRSGDGGTVTQNGGDVSVSGNFRVGHYATETSTYNMNAGTLSLTGTPGNPGTAPGGGNNEQAGILYLGIDGTGLFNHVGGDVSAYGLILDNRGDTPGTDMYTMTGGRLTLGASGIRANDSTQVNLGGGTVAASANWSTVRPISLTGAGGNTTFDTAGHDITLSGALTGNGGLVKTGDGTLAITVNADYKGPTTVSGGILDLNDAQIYTNYGWLDVPITVNNGGVIEVGGWSDTDTGGSVQAGLGKVSFSPWNIVVDGGTIRHTGATPNPNSDRAFTIGAGGTTLDASGTGTFWLEEQRNFPIASTAGGLLTLTGPGTGELEKPIPGSGGVTKTGGGTWTLEGDNTYTGTTTVSDGTLVLTGQIGVGVVADYRDDFQATTPAANWQYLWNSGGDISDPGNYSSLVSAGTSYNVEGGSLPGSEPGAYLHVAGGGGHPGRSDGQVSGNNHDRFAIAAYTVGSAGEYFLTDSFLDPINTNGDGNQVIVLVTTAGTTTQVLAVQTDNDTIAFDSPLGMLGAGDVIYVASGPDGAGAGNTDGHDSFDWDFTIRGGSAVDVQDAATLTGSGNILGTVAVATGGTLAPGDPGNPGSLESGSVTIGDGAGTAQFSVDLADGGYDRQIVTGAVTIDGAQLNVDDSSLTLPVEGQMFVVIDNDDTDAVTGTFNNAPNNGAEITVGPRTYRVYYTGNDGNDVILVNAPTPTLVYADDDWAGYSPGQLIPDPDPMVAGEFYAIFGYNAFSSVGDAITDVDTGGRVVVNAGDFSTESVNVTKTLTMDLQEGAIEFGSLDDTVNTATLNLNGITLTNGGNDADTQFDSSINGTGTLHKTGDGKLTLTHANGYGGGTVIDGGTVALGNDSGNDQNDDSLGSGQVTINNGGQLRLGGNAGGLVNHYTSNAIVLNGGAAIASIDGGQHLQGAVTVNGTDNLAFTRWAGKNLFFDAPVGGSGTLVIDDESAGTGIAAVYLTASNSLSGSIVVNGPSAGFSGGHLTIEGTLRSLSRLEVSGALHIDNTNIFTPNHGTAASVVITVDGGTWTNEPDRRNRIGDVNLLSGATWTISDPHGQWGTYYMGAVSGGPATLTVGGSSASTIGGDGNLKLGDGTIFAVNNVTTNDDIDLTVSAVLDDDAPSGAAELVKTGGGTLSLDAANTFSGGLTVDGGTVLLKGGGWDNGRAQGTGLLTINAGATVVNWNAHSFGGGADGASMFVNGGEFLLQGETYVDDITLKAGTISNYQTATGDLRTRGAGGTLITVQADDNASVVSAPLRLVSTPTIEVADGNADPDLLVSGRVFGDQGIDKSGDGTMVLSADNDYLGQTRVRAGTLALSHASHNNIAASSVITIESGGVLDVTGLSGGELQLAALATSGQQLLQGSGDVTGSVTAPAGTTIAPGTTSTTGTLTVTDNAGGVTMASGAAFDVEILGATDFDQLVVNGAVDLGGNTFPGGTLPGAVLDLTYDDAAGQGPFVLIDNDGSADKITTRFENPDIPGDVLDDGETITVATNGLKYPLRIEYDFDADNTVDGDTNLGNDVAVLFDPDVIIPATPDDDQVLIRTDATGTLLEIYVNDPTINILAGDLDPGSDDPAVNAHLFLKVPLTTMQGGSLTWAALAGNDKLAVDYTTGTFYAFDAHLPLDLDFGGDTGDFLLLTSANTGSAVATPFTTETYTLGATSGSGTIALLADATTTVPGTQTISFTTLSQHIDDEIDIPDSGTVEVIATTGQDDITLEQSTSDTGPVDSSEYRVSFAAASGYAGIDLSFKPNLTIDGEAAGDTFHLDDSNPAGMPITLLGNAGADEFVYAAGVVLDGSIDGGSDDDLLDYAAYGAVRDITLDAVGDAGAGADGFTGRDTSGTSSLSGSFAQIDAIRGSSLGGAGQSDTLHGPDLSNHWDLGGLVAGFGSFGTGGTTLTNSLTGAGVLVADAANMDLTGNASVIGRPTAGPNPIVPASGEQDLAFAGFESLVGGDDDDWFDLRDGAGLAGSLDGGGSGVDGQGDSLDYRDYTTVVEVNLGASAFDYATTPAIAPGTATNIGGGLAASAADGSSIENVFGGDADDTIAGDTDANILGDGFGSDLLDGGDGNDTFRMEPNPDAETGVDASLDRLVDPGGNDTVDFRFADPLPSNPANTGGIVFDMDLVGFDDRSNGDLTPIDPTLGEVEHLQDVFGANGTSEVSLMGHSDYNQEPPLESPFENIVGSQLDDQIEIDPLAGVIREVDGNLGWEPLAFDGGGSAVIDTGRLIPDSDPDSYRGSLTATGIGSLNYDNIEWIEPFNASPRIIDNDDVGFGYAGNWGRSTVEGYAGDVRFALAGNGGTVATWNFTGVTPGWYRAAATWEAGANRISDAQFAVFDVNAAGVASVPKTMQADGTPATEIDTINQRVAPDDFSADGAVWEELTSGTPLYFFVTGHEVQVQLSNESAATNRLFAMADAVRLERLNGADLTLDLDVDPLPAVDTAREPEIRILAGTPDTGAAELTSGFGVQDVGTIGELESASQTYTIENIGLAQLDLTITDVAGDGFRVSPIGAGLPVAAGGSMTLTITLDPSDSLTGEPLTGRLFETLSIGTNDRDENPFDITVTGFVEMADPEDAATTLDWVDNDDDSDTFGVINGDWREIRRDTRFVDNDYRYALGGNQTVQWNLDTGLSGTQLVDVAATWAAGQNRATNATYIVRDGNGDELFRRSVNQNVAPDDFENAGAMWEVLGTVKMTTGSALTVELTTDNANGYVVADAVWVGTSMTPAVVVTHDEQELINNVSVIDYEYVELNPNPDPDLERVITVSSVAGVGVDVYLPIEMPAGFSLVESTDTLDLLDGTPDGKVALTAVGGTLDSFSFTVRVDAQAPGNVAGTVSFYSQDADAAPFQFAVAAQVGVQVVDNDNPGFSQGGNGSGFGFYGDPRAFGGDIRYHGKGTGENYVDYEFTGLTQGQNYRISTTWTTGLSRTSRTEYQAYDLPQSAISPIDTPVATASVDQRVAPDDFQYAGEAWENLTIVQVAASTTLTVRLTDNADNWVYADAIRIEQVYLPTAEVTIGGQFHQSGQSLDLGTVLELPGSPAPATAASEDITIRNLGALPLELSVPGLSAGSNINLDVSGVPEWVGGLPVTLGPGEEVTFSVGVNNSAGFYSGTVLLNTNDVAAPQFELPVSGRVVDRLVMDESDGDGGITGDFPRVNRDTRYYNQDYRYSAAGDGSDTLRWGTFTGLVIGEVYEVSTTYVASSTRASNAPYKVTGGTLTEVTGGATVNTAGDTAYVNQRAAPDSFTDGRGWEYLGLVTMTGTTLSIELSDLANGYVIADAVRVDVPDNLHLGAAQRTDSPAAPITADVVAPVLTEALAMWESTGLTAAETERLSGVQVQVTNLPGTKLGLASAHGTQIWIDANAAGYGWNVDEGVTRGQGEGVRGRQGEGVTSSVDLLSVLAHEVGHILGHEHDDDHGVMAATLAPTVVPGGSPAALSPSRVSSSSAPTHRVGDQSSVFSDQLSVFSDQSSVIGDQWFRPWSEDRGDAPDAAPTSAFRTPTSDFEMTSDSRLPISAYDNVFARLDDGAGELADSSWDEDADDEDRDGDSQEDSLDLWTVLYGLE